MDALNEAARITLARERLDALKREIARRIVGHHELINGILACLLLLGTEMLLRPVFGMR